MAKVVQQSPREAAVRKASRTMSILLKTPKTREGLVAAVASEMVSKRFIFGWLTEQVRTGNVSQFKSARTVLYQIRGTFIKEPVSRSDYPNWLEPRTLPTVRSGTVFVDGVLVTDYPNLKEEEDCE